MIEDCRQAGLVITEKKELCCIKHQNYWQDIIMYLIVWELSDNDFRLKYGFTKDEAHAQLKELMKIITIKDLNFIFV